MRKKTVFTTSLVIIFILLGTILAIFYGKGYRLNFGGNGNQIIAGTGLLVLTSTPDGARVYLDDNLTTATNDTLNLPPGEYDVRIEKDGYYPWKKHVTLTKEAVTKTDALLFPSAPKLEAITLLGAENPIVNSNGSLLAYRVSSSSAQNNGIYVINLTNRPLIPLGNTSRQIASDRIDSFSKATLEFSPDGQEILASIPPSSTSSGGTKLYLLRTDGLNDNPQNVTVTITQLRSQWELEEKELEQKFTNIIPRKARPFVTSNFLNPKLSPESDKIVYTASESASMPIFITPALPTTNSTPENRELKAGNVYVYQIKEDKNYLLYEPQEGETAPNFIWHPSSSHLVFIKDKRIYAIEYDGQNLTTLYSGPFSSNFVYPWPDGSGIIIRTNLNDETIPANLYTVGLK